MVVRLQTAEGKIKKYDTIYAVGGEGEYGPDKYASKCGREWKKKPKEHEECHHLDCAIHAAEYASNYQKSHFKVFLCIVIFWLLVPFFVAIYGFIKYDMPLNLAAWSEISLMLLLTPIGGIPALLAIYYIWQSDKSAKKAKGLLEFRDHGTINDVKASQFFEDQEEAKDKHWWLFWR